MAKNELLQSLRSEIAQSIGYANATGTVNTSNSATRSFLLYLELTDQREEVDRSGVSDDALAGFCMWAVRGDAISYRTLRNYISMGVRVYLLENNLEWVPVSQRYHVCKTLKSIRRLKGDVTSPVLAVSIEVLSEMASMTRLDSPCGACMNAAMSTAFFLILRKGNICDAKMDSTNTRQPIKRKQLVWYNDEGRYWIKIVHTKTIQFQEKVLWLPVPCFPSLPDICPTQALNRHLTINNPGMEDNLFSYSGKPLSYRTFVTQFKSLLAKCGIDHKNFGGHSFRRGGATWMFSVLKLPAELIKVMGDWKSQAFQLYTNVTTSFKLEAVDAMHRAVAGQQWGVRMPTSAGGQVDSLTLWNPSDPEQ